MSELSSNMEVDILGKSYQISFADNEKEALLRAVDYLNKHIQETKDKKSYNSNESLLAITALNLTNELLTSRYLMKSHDTAINRQLKSISEKLGGICGNRIAATSVIKDFGTTL